MAYERVPSLFFCHDRRYLCRTDRIRVSPAGYQLVFSVVDSVLVVSRLESTTLHDMSPTVLPIELRSTVEDVPPGLEKLKFTSMS